MYIMKSVDRDGIGCSPHRELLFGERRRECSVFGSPLSCAADIQAASGAPVTELSVAGQSRVPITAIGTRVVQWMLRLSPLD